MRQELETLRDKLVQEIAACDYGRQGALLAHDALTEFIDGGHLDNLDSNILDMQREIDELKAVPKVEVVDVAALTRWIAKVRPDLLLKPKARTRKPSPRRSTKAQRIARAGQKQRKCVARKSQSRRA